MPTHPITEGELGYDVPGAGVSSKTWYKVIGSLESDIPALIGLHGGPGAGHEYHEPLTDILQAYGIPIVLYDQIGCGRSTHFRDRMGDEAFWSFDLFIGELDNLIDHLQLRKKGFFILGSSWGGILGATYAVRNPQGLKKLVIAGGPASISLYLRGLQTLLSGLPPEVRKAIEEGEKKGDIGNAEYQKALAVFHGRHVCRLDPYPEEIMAGFKNLQDDPTAYMTIQGPTEFTLTGPIKDYEGWKDAHKIQVETLILNGRYDEVTDMSIEPWFQHIPKVKWVTLENASHMPHFEERERFMYLVGSFLAGAGL